MALGASSRNGRRGPLLIASASAVTALAVVLSLQVSDSGAVPYYALFLGATFGVALYTIAIQVARGRQIDFLSPFVLVPFTMGFVYSGAPALLLREGNSQFAQEVSLALLIGMLGYLAGAAFVSVLTTALNNMPEPFCFDTRRRNPRVYSVIFALGAAAMAAYWVKAGGVPILKADLENSRIEALTGSGVPFYLSMLMMPATWLALAKDSGASRRTQILMLSAGSLLLFSTGWRNTVFAFIVVAILIWYYTRGIRAAHVVAAGVIAVLGVIGVGLYRVYSSGITSYRTYQLLVSGDVLGAITAYLQTYADAFGRNLAAVFQVVPTTLPYQYGETLIWNFLALTPGHVREPFDFVLKNAAGQGFEGGGLPPTLIGEWFINFGWIGIVAGMAATGATVAVAHSRMITTTRYSHFVVAIIVGYYAFVAVRGGIGNVLLTATWLSLATLLTSWLAGRHTDRFQVAGHSLARRLEIGRR